MTSISVCCRTVASAGSTGKQRVRILTGLLILLAGTASADTQHFYGAWSALTITGALGEEKPDGAGWRYWFDSQYRVFDIGSGVSQVFARPALGYRLSNGVSLWAGYGYFNTRRSSGKRVDENRYWQQVETPAYSVADAAVAVRVPQG